MRYLFMVCVLIVSFLHGKDVNSSSISLAKKSDKPYVKSLMRNMAHPDVWKSRKRKKILEILYGKDIHMIQSDKLKITDSIKIETDLKLKSLRESSLQNERSICLIHLFHLLSNQ